MTFFTDVEANILLSQYLVSGFYLLSWGQVIVQTESGTRNDCSKRLKVTQDQVICLSTYKVPISHQYWNFSQYTNLCGQTPMRIFWFTARNRMRNFIHKCYEWNIVIKKLSLIHLPRKPDDTMRMASFSWRNACGGKKISRSSDTVMLPEGKKNTDLGPMKDTNKRGKLNEWFLYWKRGWGLIRKKYFEVKIFHHSFTKEILKIYLSSNSFLLNLEVWKIGELT